MLITIKQKFNILNKLKRFSKSLQKQWTIKFIPRFYTGKVVARKKDFNIFSLSRDVPRLRFSE